MLICNPFLVLVWMELSDLYGMVNATLFHLSKAMLRFQLEILRRRIGAFLRGKEGPRS